MLAWNISAWRVTSLLLGLCCVWIATATPIAVLDERMLTGHMVQHLLLMTIAPPLIWLGAPMRVWTGPAPRRLLPQKVGRVLGNLVVCWLAAAATLVAWHEPAIFRLGMQSGSWHLVEQLSFLATGLLFWWPVIQASPRWSILLYLFLASLPCDVLSGFLVFDRIAYPMYLCQPQNSALSVLDDQQRAGALMWTVVTVVYLAAGTILAARLLSPGRRPAPLEVI